MKCMLIVVVAALIAVGGCRITKVCNSDGGMEIAQSENAAVATPKTMDAKIRFPFGIDSCGLMRTAQKCCLETPFGEL